MKLLNVIQGTPEWLEARRKYRTASEAPNVMGVGFIKRELFVKQTALGIEEEPSEFVKQLFERGHEAEALARVIIEEDLGVDLYPVTGVHEDGIHSASFDGLSEDRTLIFEHKLWNKDLAKKVQENDLPPKYYWQLEHQLYVSGADSVIFATSDGTRENFAKTLYSPVKGRLKKLLAGWEQFEKDVAEFETAQPAKKTEAEVEAPKTADRMETLPAIRFKMDGMALTSNLLTYTEAATALVERSKIKIETDQDFVNSEALNKKLKTAEDYLETIKGDVLSEVSSIEKFTKDIDELKDLLRQARLNGERQVKNRKEEIREEVIRAGQAKYSDFVSELNQKLNGFFMPKIPSNFADAIKGRKTVQSLNDAASDHLAEMKLQATEMFERMEANYKLFETKAKNFGSLFPDLSNLLPDPAFEHIISSRINAFKVEQQEQKAREEAAAAAKAIAEAAAKQQEEEKREAEQRAIAHTEPVIIPEKQPVQEPVSIFQENDDIGHPGDDYSPEHINPANRLMGDDADKEHRYKVHVAVKACLVSYGCSPELATELVKRISSGEIVRVKILY